MFCSRGMGAARVGGVITGDRPQASPRTAGDDIHDAFHQDARRTFSRTLAAVGSQPADGHRIHADGQYGTRERIEARLIAVDASRVLTITRDITNRWRPSRSSRETQHRYALATTAAASACGTPRRQRRTAGLGTLHKCWGTGDGEIPGSPRRVAVAASSPDDHDEVMARLAAVLRGEMPPVSMSSSGWCTRTAPVRWIAGKGAVTETCGGRPLRVTGTYADITERRESARLLREANDAVVRMNRIGTIAEMSASIAHELNQPLTAIRRPR